MPGPGPIADLQPLYNKPLQQYWFNESFFSALMIRMQNEKKKYKINFMNLLMGEVIKEMALQKKNEKMHSLSPVELISSGWIHHPRCGV